MDKCAQMAQPYCHIAKEPGAASVTNQAQSDDITKQCVQLTEQFTVAARQINWPSVRRTVRLCGFYLDSIAPLGILQTPLVVVGVVTRGWLPVQSLIVLMKLIAIFFVSYLFFFNSKLPLSSFISSSSNDWAHSRVYLRRCMRQPSLCSRPDSCRHNAHQKVYDNRYLLQIHSSRRASTISTSIFISISSSARVSVVPAPHRHQTGKHHRRSRQLLSRSSRADGTAAA